MQSSGRVSGRVTYPSNKRATVGAEHSLTMQGSPSCTIRVEIDENAYLSSASTESGSDSDLEETADEIRRQVLRIFQRQVSEEEAVTVDWVRDTGSYCVHLRMPFLAAELLCHLVEAGNPVVFELGISAVMYGARCAGVERDKVLEEHVRSMLMEAITSAEVGAVAP